MIKLLLFFWPKAGLARQEFIDYYEQRHAPLGARLTGGAVDYRRNYPLWSERDSQQFWVMTEVWHDTRAGLEAQIATRAASPTREALDRDEAAFMNRERRFSIAVEECVSHRCVAHQAQTQPLEKLMRFVFVSDAADGFRARYEEQAKHGAHESVHHIRNYPIADDPFTTSSDLSGRQVAIIEELWLHPTAPLSDLDHVFPSALQQRTLTVRVQERRTPGGRQMAPLAERD